jgi:hypothetical protein
MSLLSTTEALTVLAEGSRYENLSPYAIGGATLGGLLLLLWITTRFNRDR